MFGAECLREVSQFKLPLLSVAKRTFPEHGIISFLIIFLTNLASLQPATEINVTQR